MTSGYFSNVRASLLMNKNFKNLRYVTSKLWRNVDLSFWYSVDRRTLSVNDFFYNKYRYPYCSKYQKLVSFLRSNCFFFVNPVREASMFLFKYERHWSNCLRWLLYGFNYDAYLDKNRTSNTFSYKVYHLGISFKKILEIISGVFYFWFLLFFDYRLQGLYSEEERDLRLYYGSALFEGNLKLSLVQELCLFLDDMSDQSIYCIYRSRRFVQTMFLGLTVPFQEETSYLKRATGSLTHFLDGHDESSSSNLSSIICAQFFMYYKYPSCKFSICIPTMSSLETSESYINAYGWLDSAYTCTTSSSLSRQVGESLRYSLYTG